MTRIDIADARDPAEVAAVADLFREYVFRIGRDHGVDVSYQDFEGEMATFPARFERLILARVNSAPAAAIALKRLSDTDCEMKRLFVRDTFRGLGLARMLVEALIDGARTAGYRVMRLDTHASMTLAIHLYESFGFAPSEPHNEPGNPDTLFFARTL